MYHALPKMLVNFDLENRKVNLVMQKAKEKLQMIQVTTKYDKNLKKKLTRRNSCQLPGRGRKMPPLLARTSFNGAAVLHSERPLSLALPGTCRL